MKSMIPIFSTFLLCCFINTTKAQPPYPEWKQYIAVREIQDMLLIENTLYTASWGSGLIEFNLNTNETTVYSTYSSGIASDEITAIDVDNSGNIWLGHYGYGVSKLSGNYCTIFDTDNSDLIDDKITTICVDLNEKVWIGTWSGICSFDGQEWESYTQNNSDLPNDTVHVIVVDEENNKWIGYKGGFAIFDDTNWEIHNMFPSGLNTPYIENIAFDENGIAWIDVHQYGSSLYKFDGDTIEYMNWPPPLYNYISDMDFASNGDMWISVWSGMDDIGLAMYDGEIFMEFDFSEMTDYLENQSRTVVIDENDYKWIGTMDNGLLKYKEGNIGRINNGIFGLHPPHKMAIENNDRIWITTIDGLNEYNSGEWIFYTNYNSDYPAASSYSIAIDNNNKKWIGDDDQLITYDDENWVVYDTSNSPIGYGYSYIKDIIIDKNDIKWFTKNGLYKFDDQSWNVYTTDNSEIPSDNIQCMAADSNGIIWMGYLGIGVSSFDGYEWHLFDTTIAGSQIYFPRSIYVDSINTKWICTSEGLLSFNGITWSVYDTSNSGLPSNNIWDILFDNNGKMWVGTDNGIGVYDGDTWKLHDTSNSSLKDNVVKSIDKSANNSIWIITQDGISVYNENGFLAIEDNFQNFKPGIKLISSPNPFKSETSFQFNLNKISFSEIIIYNIKGQTIKKIFKGKLNAGEYQFSWDGTNDNGSFVNQGIYFCQLQTAESSAHCKVVFLRD